MRVETVQDRPESAIRQIGVSEVTYYRWRQEFGGLKIEQVKRLKANEAMTTPIAPGFERDSADELRRRIVNEAGGMGLNFNRRWWLVPSRSAGIGQRQVAPPMSGDRSIFVAVLDQYNVASSHIHSLTTYNF